MKRGWISSKEQYTIGASDDISFVFLSRYFVWLPSHVRHWCGFYRNSAAKRPKVFSWFPPPITICVVYNRHCFDIWAVYQYIKVFLQITLYFGFNLDFKSILLVLNVFLLNVTSRLVVSMYMHADIYLYTCYMHIAVCNVITHTGVGLYRQNITFSGQVSKVYTRRSKYMACLKGDTWVR